MACGILDICVQQSVCDVRFTSLVHGILMPMYVTARWSPDRKWKTVSVDPSGTVATKTDEHGSYGYVQTTEAVSKGVHTW